MDIIDKIFHLLSVRGVSAAQLSREAGITNSLFTQWKQRKQHPSAANVAKIAAYFGVSADELLGIEKPAAPEGEQPEQTEHQRLVKELTERAAHKSAEALTAIIAMMDQIENRRKP